MSDMEGRLAELEKRVARIEGISGDADDVLTTRQVGRMLGKSPSAVRLLIDAGKIESLPREPGGALRITRAAVHAYIEGLKSRIRRRQRVGAA